MPKEGPLWFHCRFFSQTADLSAKAMLLIRFCCLLGLARLSWAARLSKEERSQPDVVDGPVDGPAIHWHDSKACREVKEFAPEPAVLKINLDLSKVLPPQFALRKQHL